MAQNSSPSAATARSNARIGIAITGVVFMMLGASFAAVPLYDLFCRATGFGGRTMQATAAPSSVSDRVFTIRFAANVAAGLPWRFTPEQPEITIKAGEVKTVGYSITNKGDRPTFGTATFNVTPEQTGAYFNKIACFCFTEVPLAVGETRNEEVVFFIDPAISNDKSLDGIQSITLSYTFFPVKNPARPVADAGTAISSPGQPGVTKSR